MRYSTGAKFFISLMIFFPFVALWLLHAGQTPAQRWPANNSKISCPGSDPLEVHTLSQLDRKINKIVSSRRADRSALCITNPKAGEWDIYGGQRIELIQQQDD